MLEQELADKMGMTLSRFCIALHSLSFEDGLLKLPSRFKSMELFEYFSTLILDDLIPMRVPIGILVSSAEQGDSNTQYKINRLHGLNENILTLSNNFGKMILPRDILDKHVCYVRESGDYYANELAFKAPGELVVHPLNNHYVFSAYKAVEIKIISKVSRGVSSISDNSVSLSSEPAYLPIQSNHTLSDRLVLIAPVQDGIRYRITEDIDDATLTLLFKDYFKSLVRKDSDEEEVPMMNNYNSPVYWVELYVKMMQDLKFDRHKKSSWTKFNRKVPNISTLGDFERFLNTQFKDDAIKKLSGVKGVSVDFATLVIDYLNDYFERRLL